ncbi:MAG: glycerol-3-phosphate dehydrogenase [Deltaproteobacteria bacterium]|nr:glycerol-3-phosphate dehydrogenase [Deltaproteobacteria bacterium]
MAHPAPPPRGPIALSPALRRANLARLASESFDLLVIGGGINGAGIARDAALRGLRVALVEKGDFASGTSSRSSKLIHGGLRYLEMGDFRLVREACKERDRLRRRLAPHLVKPLPFLFPVYSGDPVGLFRLGLGMWAYDILASMRNIKMHRRLSPRKVASLEPGLKQDGLKGAEIYYDCATDDARLTLETIMGASGEGAVVVNYVNLLEFLKDAGHIVGARLHDEQSAQALEVRAKVVVNATGPWVDEVRRLDDPATRPCLRLTKGVHLVVPRARVGNRFAVVLRSPRDHRILFVIPWEDRTLVGTTDTDFSGSPDAVGVEPGDVAYLLEAVNAFFPDARLVPGDVVGCFAGLRPLAANDGAIDPSAVSREERIIESPSGLISVAGGKLTTFRLVAQSVTDKVLRFLPRKTAATAKARRRSKNLPLPGGVRTANGNRARSAQQEAARDDYLSQRYGARAPEVMALMQHNADLASPIVAGMPYTKGEAVYAVEAEMAQKVEDILRRRTLVEVRDQDAADRVARELEALIAPLLRSREAKPPAT